MCQCAGAVVQHLKTCALMIFLMYETAARLGVSAMDLITKQLITPRHNSAQYNISRSETTLQAQEPALITKFLCGFDKLNHHNTALLLGLQKGAEPVEAPVLSTKPTGPRACRGAIVFRNTRPVLMSVGLKKLIRKQRNPT